MFTTRRSLLRVLEREREAFVAERSRLIDQIMHLSDRTWTLPPREQVTQQASEDPADEWVDA